MKILFSPVGMTDPVSEDRKQLTDGQPAVREGALLQICRHERPDKIILYFSKEACDLEQQDHRYLGGLELLEQSLGISFDIEVIERPALTEVHLFDVFLRDFRDILTKLRDDYPDAELLVNVSSGTPAMKSTLQILASATELDLKPLQVATPNKQTNHPRECNIQQEWTRNADLLPEAENRVTVSEHTNLLYEFNRRVLAKLIDEYDYHAAKTVSVQLRGLISPKFTSLLDAAILRSDAKFRDAQQKFRECGREDLMSGNMQTAEYFLLLDIYVKKEKYTDFLRALTPFLLEILLAAIRKQFQMDMTRYMMPNSRTWDERNQDLQDMIDLFDESSAYHANPRQYKYNRIKSFVTSADLSNIIENKADPKRQKQLVMDTLKLRQDVEERIRNLAAHTMNGVSAMDIQKACSLSPQKLIELLKSYVRNYTDIPLTDAFLQSYQLMNEKLKSYL